MLKKWIVGCVTAAALLLPGTTMAESSKTIPVVFNEIHIKVDGKAATGNTILYDGTTYVPIRNLAEMMYNLPVTFYPKENIANIGFVPAGQKEPGIRAAETDTTKDDVLEPKRTETIPVVFDAITIMVNLEKVKTSNLLYNGRTYVPLRAVADILELELFFDAPTSTAYIGKIPPGAIQTTAPAVETAEPPQQPDQPAQAEAGSGMYAVPADGDMAGWNLLVGHPYEGAVHIYFKLNGSIMSTKIVDIRQVDLNQKVTWVDDSGVTRTNTVGQIYRLFGSFSQYTSEWFSEKFGDLYADWLLTSTIQADKIVDQYLTENGLKQPPRSNITLTPGAKVR